MTEIFSQGFTSGFEASAGGGEGYGIQTFKPQRGPLKISANLKIANLAKVLQRMGERADDFVQPAEQQDPKRVLRNWTPEELEAAELAGSPIKPFSNPTTPQLPCY